LKRAKVYFANARSRERKESMVLKLERLLGESEIMDVFSKGETVAVKVHMGHKLCTRYVRPNFIRTIVDKIRDAGGVPFVTDTTGLGLALRPTSSHRYNAKDYLSMAVEHGFTPETVNAPIIIADGLWGDDDVEVSFDGLKLKKISVAKAIVQADSVISVAHFKGHDLTGFGGSLKNIGVGCTSKAGKFALHGTGKPSINLDVCDGCGICLKYCFAGAITIKNGKAFIDSDRCSGCLHCNGQCPLDAVKVGWEKSDVFQVKMVDAVAAVMKVVGNEHIGYVNFALDITPLCDCAPSSDAPIVPDIGVFASEDPVAIDKASVDSVNDSIGMPGSAAEEAGALARGSDKFRLIHKLDWNAQFEAATRLGIGNTEYDLIAVS